MNETPRTRDVVDSTSVPYHESLPVSQRPQFVALTFDDGFGLEAGGIGGVNDIVELCRQRHNPPGAGDSAVFDSSPLHTTLYLNTQWGKSPENFHAWVRAAAAGHELANHTETHPNGGDVASGRYTPQRFDVSAWCKHISPARAFLADELGIDLLRAGFRAPFLSYNDAMFAALKQLGYLYDSSIIGGLLNDEDGRVCRWPYLLDGGSPHATGLRESHGLPQLTPHSGLWEVPVSTVLVPPDELAGTYDFRPGLFDRVGRSMPYPSLSDPERGKIAGLDWALLVDNAFSPKEMTATLAYTLDLRLAGNRAPLVFCAHTFMYSFSAEGGNDNTDSLETRAERWNALVAFVDYALTKKQVRFCTMKELVSWMAHPVPLAG